ncbi:hypothetical protein RUND412_005566 [Rhizina undulata]
MIPPRVKQLEPITDIQDEAAREFMLIADLAKYKITVDKMTTFERYQEFKDVSSEDLNLVIRDPYPYHPYNGPYLETMCLVPGWVNICCAQKDFEAIKNMSTSIREEYRAFTGASEEKRGSVGNFWGSPEEAEHCKNWVCEVTCPHNEGVPFKSRIHF